MLGKPIDQNQDIERWRRVAARQMDEAERRVAEAADRVRDAERSLAEAQSRLEVELACAVAARAWRDRVEQSDRVAAPGARSDRAAPPPRAARAA
jgi:hypothetical protein